MEKEGFEEKPHRDGEGEPDQEGDATNEGLFTLVDEEVFPLAEYESDPAPQLPSSLREAISKRFSGKEEAERVVGAAREAAAKAIQTQMEVRSRAASRLKEIYSDEHVKAKILVLGLQYGLRAGIPIPVLDRMIAWCGRKIYMKDLGLTESDFQKADTRVSGRERAAIRRWFHNKILIGIFEGAEALVPFSDFAISFFEASKQLKQLPEWDEIERCLKTLLTGRNLLQQGKIEEGEPDGE